MRLTMTPQTRLLKSYLGYIVPKDWERVIFEIITENVLYQYDFQVLWNLTYPDHPVPRYAASYAVKAVDIMTFVLGLRP